MSNRIQPDDRLQLKLDLFAALSEFLEESDIERKGYRYFYLGDEAVSLMAEAAASVYLAIADTHSYMEGMSDE